MKALPTRTQVSSDQATRASRGTHPARPAMRVRHSPGAPLRSTRCEGAPPMLNTMLSSPRTKRSRRMAAAASFMELHSMVAVVLDMVVGAR